jgi:hypothetical protein
VRVRCAWAGILHFSEGAATQPFVKMLSKDIGALEFDITTDLCGSERQITHPDAGLRLEVGRDIEIDLKSGIWDFKNTG